MAVSPVSDHQGGTPPPYPVQQDSAGVDSGPADSLQTPPLLEVRDIARSFGTVRALAGVSFAVRKGEVLGLIGENGAGKSTVLNIISGTDNGGTGEVLVRGKKVNFASYHQATEAGVFRIFQELALVPNMTVWENLFLSHERHFTSGGLIRRRSAIRRARELLDRFDHGWIDPLAKVESYPFAVRQVIEVLKAFALADLLGHAEPIVLLDEPTAALASDEIHFLHDLLVKVRDQSAVVFVSHRLSELLDWSDRIVVFKDGRMITEEPAASLTEEKLHFLMVGRERDDQFYKEHRQREPESDDPALELIELSDGSSFRDVSLTVRRGEILGVAGVLGSGKTELGRAVFGANRITSGTMRHWGKTVENLTPTVAARNRVGYVSPERKEDGLLDTFSVAENISFARIATQKGPLLSLGREKTEARHYIQAMRIKTPSPNELVVNLSGGNQQKAILARWLARGVDLLVLDNPTRGVDAGAKEEIYDIIRGLTDDGVAVLLISDDLLEVIGLSNRIVVMKDGAPARQIDAPVNAKPHETDLVAAMV